MGDGTPQFARLAIRVSPGEKGEGSVGGADKVFWIGSHGADSVDVRNEVVVGEFDSFGLSLRFSEFKR